jgi:hypothetical protein
MSTEPITIRDRLQDYEFTDDQEINLTLELLNRIEKDIDELRAKKTRDGFSEYVALGGLAAALFVLLGELSKVTQISFSSVGLIFFSGLLLLKIPWALYQLIAIDQATKSRHEKGRFFWSNDLFFENRVAGLFQALVFLVSVPLLFWLHLPVWVATSTAVAFLLYIFILGLVFVLSFKKEPFTPDNTRKLAMVGLPSLFLAITTLSVTGLMSRMTIPVGNETFPFVVAGLLLTLVFFVDRLIRLSTPSLLLAKLERLRYDIIFLKAELRDAWTRYEVHVYGHDISEELREDMDDIIRSFNMLDYGQSQKEKFVSLIQDEIKRLKVEIENRTLTENDFGGVTTHKREFFVHFDAVKRLFDQLQPRLDKLAKEINRISRSTQEWQRADQYHQFILTRLATINEKDKQIAQNGTEIDNEINQLLLKEVAQSLANNKAQSSDKEIH